jgi:hypothetical protein
MSPQPAPAVVTDNWERLIGTWIADNSAFKDANDTTDAYGIDWSWGLGRKSLIGRLYGIKDGKEIGTFWEFREFWDPGQGQVMATQFGGNGTYGVGPHEIRADGGIMRLKGGAGTRRVGTGRRTRASPAPWARRSAAPRPS